MEFRIAECNMDRLEKKLNRIKKKCEKYGCEFRYERIGECFKEIPNPDYDSELGNDKMITIKQIIINVEGEAILSDWHLVASVERTDNGNIFRKATDEEVPQRYYDSYPVCEHCKTNRPRKMTYIVKNEKTNEFKQVGNSCLCDFCHGRSAEAVASYISMFDELISGDYSEPSGFGGFERYFETEELLRYAAETIRKFGYVKVNDIDGNRNPDCTKDRVTKYFECDHGLLRSSYYGYDPKAEAEREMKSVGFNANSVEVTQLVTNAVEYIKAEEEKNDFIHNLKVLVANEHNSLGKIGMFAPLFPMYNKHLEIEAIKEKRTKANVNEQKQSQYVGQLKERITIDHPEVQVISSYETEFGYTYIHKIKDEDGNVFIWKSSSGSYSKADKIIGTVKDHSEFRGVKQTILTRCKVFAA